MGNEWNIYLFEVVVSSSFEGRNQDNIRLYRHYYLSIEISFDAYFVDFPALYSLLNLLIK